MDAAIGESNGFSQAVHGHHSRGDSTGSFDGGPSDCVRGKLNGVKWTSALRQFHHDGSASRSDSAMTNGRRNGETNDIAAYRPGSAARAVANALNTRLTNGSTRGMQNGVHNSLDPAALPTAKESSADLVHPNGTSDPLGADAAAIVAHQNGVAAESKQPTPESQEPTAKPEDTRRGASRSRHKAFAIASSSCSALLPPLQESAGCLLQIVFHPESDEAKKLYQYQLCLASALRQAFEKSHPKQCVTSASQGGQFWAPAVTRC